MEEANVDQEQGATFERQWREEENRFRAKNSSDARGPPGLPPETTSSSGGSRPPGAGVAPRTMQGLGQPKGAQTKRSQAQAPLPARHWPRFPALATDQVHGQRGPGR